MDIKIPNSLNIQSTNLKGNDKQHILFISRGDIASLFICYLL